MTPRALPVTCALAAGLSALTVAAPAGAAPTEPGARAIGAYAGAPAVAAAVRAAQEGDRPGSTIAISSNARTAHAGRYAKFLSTFRCDAGRHYELFGMLYQSEGEEPTALASSNDEGPTGVCTGRTQRRMVYLVVEPLEPDQRGPIPTLRTGHGEATVVLATAKTRRAEPRLDAAALNRVRVTPR